MANCSTCVRRKIEPNIPKNITKLTAFVAAKVRDRNSSSGTIGAGARRSQATKAATSARARGHRREDERARPAVRVAAHEAEDHAEQAEAHEGDAGHVEALGRPAALAQAARGEGQEQEPERDVEPEDPLPGQPVDDQPAEQRPDGDAEAAHAGPHAQGEPAALGRVGGRQQRQRQRGDDRAPGALQRAGQDERARRRGQGRGGRGEREEGEAGQEDAAAPEAVAERGGRDEQHREGQRVGVDRPLQVLDGRAEVLPDRGQRDRDDEVVQRGHEQRGGDDEEGAQGGGHVGSR